MRLTRAQRRILERLRDAEDANDARDDVVSDAPPNYEDDEIACQGIECWIGLDRTNWRLVLALLRIMAISDRSDHSNGSLGGGSFRRFRINETGRAYLNDETQIDAVIDALRTGRPITWKDGKAVALEL